MLPDPKNPPYPTESRSVVLLLECSFYFPGFQSLKEKRQVVQSILHGILPRFGAVGTVVDGMESHTRVTLGIVLISSSETEIRKRAESLIQKLEQNPSYHIYEVRRYPFVPPES